MVALGWARHQRVQEWLAWFDATEGWEDDPTAAAAVLAACRGGLRPILQERAVEWPRTCVGCRTWWFDPHRPSEPPQNRSRRDLCDPGLHRGRVAGRVATRPRPAAAVPGRKGPVEKELRNPAEPGSRSSATLQVDHLQGHQSHARLRRRGRAPAAVPVSAPPVDVRTETPRCCEFFHEGAWDTYREAQWNRKDAKHAKMPPRIAV